MESRWPRLIWEKVVPSGGKLRAGNVRAPPLPLLLLLLPLPLLLAGAVDAADVDVEAELSEASAAGLLLLLLLRAGFGRPGAVPLSAARFAASAIVLLAAEISAFSSTRTVHGLVVGYDILNTLDAEMIKTVN